LNLLQAFQNQQDCLWPTFKSGGRYAAPFSKENCSSATYLLDFKTGEIASFAGFQKLSVQLRDNCNPRGPKDFNSQINKLLALSG
jgi:hypothetical protein